MSEKINKLKDMLVKNISSINDDIMLNLKYIEKCKKKSIKNNNYNNRAHLAFLMKEREIFLTKKTSLLDILIFLEE
jgi:hypothetical protein